MSEPRFPNWLARAPCLVAESLRTVRDPLAAWLKPPAAAAPEAVAAALARALLPPEAETDPPGWLRPDQRLSFRRALAAVRRYRGALLADGVGTGKTYIGLAVAAALEPRRPVWVLAPAALIAQWREAARHTGVPVLVHSHETLSRGRLPGADPGTVIVDESHRFRTGTTRRYETLAPWCVGRSGLLVSATPAVNRLADVARQLLLFVRDDALSWSGVPSLLASLDHRAPDALAHLVVTGEDRSRLLPEMVPREVCPEEPSSTFWMIQYGISALRLSEDPITAGLIRTVLLQALASSPAAAVQALARYRALLLHAKDAAAAGLNVSRNAIRQLAGSSGDQLVLWPLVAENAPLPDLAISDLNGVMVLEAQCREWCGGWDGKRAALAAITADGKSSLVFTTHIATVRHLRAGLGLRRVAWCTGSMAGVDQTALPRGTVLDWFRRPVLPTDAVQSRPRLLVTTDVAAEGLDLPLVDRVVHYDLPWTAVRLDQRSGRALRLGSTRKAVEVIRFRPPPALEAAIHKEAILDAKAGLPHVLGLGAEQNAPWRLRAGVAAEWSGVFASEGIAACHGSSVGAVAGFRIGTGDASVREIVLARTSAGWTEDLEAVARLLECARGSTQLTAANPVQVRAVVRGLSGLVRTALRITHGAGIASAPKSPLVKTATRRLLVLARRAARERRSDRLGALTRGIAFLRRGHTAGERRIAEGWPGMPERELLNALERLPVEEGPVRVGRLELIGVLLVERRR